LELESTSATTQQARVKGSFGTYAQHEIEDHSDIAFDMVVKYAPVPSHADMLLKKHLIITAEIKIEDPKLRENNKVQKMVAILKNTVESLNRFEGKLTKKT
jgi:hypothetical protein